MAEAGNTIIDEPLEDDIDGGIDAVGTALRRVAFGAVDPLVSSESIAAAFLCPALCHLVKAGIRRENVDRGHRIEFIEQALLVLRERRINAVALRMLIVFDFNSSELLGIESCQVEIHHHLFFDIGHVRR